MAKDRQILIVGAKGHLCGNSVRLDRCDCEGFHIIGIEKCPKGAVITLPVRAGIYSDEKLMEFAELVAEIFQLGKFTMRVFEGDNPEDSEDMEGVNAPLH